MKDMLSETKGSGDYYGVEFHPEFITLSDYRSSLQSDPPELIADGVHLYRDKHHHWAEATLSLDEWFAQTTNDGWLQYWSKIGLRSFQILRSRLIIQWRIGERIPAANKQD